MKENSFELKETFQATTKEIYEAWLNSEEHETMTGGGASCSNQEGGDHSAWDGYIWGKNKKLIPNSEIVQTWRTTEFEESDEDSLLTIKLKKIDQGCELTLIHENIPEGQTDRYKSGWIQHYFEPMKNHFNY